MVPIPDLKLGFHSGVANCCVCLFYWYLILLFIEREKFVRFERLTHRLPLRLNVKIVVISQQ
jgi:hypothetical protein